jgi:sugar lactone lactonase YvrE
LTVPSQLSSKSLLLFASETLSAGYQVQFLPRVKSAGAVETSGRVGANTSCVGEAGATGHFGKRQPDERKLDGWRVIGHKEGMNLPKPPLGSRHRLDAGRAGLNAARRTCCVAFVLAAGCTDARVLSKASRADAGSSQVTRVVEAGPRVVSKAPDAATSDTTFVRPDAAIPAAIDAGVTSTARPPLDAGVQTVVDAQPDAMSPVQPSLCESLPAAPVTFFAQYGFERSEDFSFDELGNYVGVDQNNNLVRITDVGRRELWAPNIAGTTAGMSILPDGSVVVCDVSEGSIKRIYTNGYSETVLAGLEYPNGLDIGPDGFIYVAENNAGRVRRIDPDTGEFTIVAIGLFGPNGVAFGNDPTIMYIGSFEGSGVYRVDLPASGELGQARVLARPNGSKLPEPRLACPDQIEGRECHLGYANGSPGRCQRVANVVDCFRYDRCDQLPNGTACDYPEAGLCDDGVCTPPCEGADLWDACELSYEGGQGVCAPQFDGSLRCRPSSPCDQMEEGDVCSLDGVEGTCGVYSEDYYGEYGVLYCEVPGPCADKDVGDQCITDGLPGTCQDDGYTELNCQLPTPCDGKSEGDACEAWVGVEGVCSDSEYGLECTVVNPCEGQEDGTSCEDSYSGMAGTCRVYSYDPDETYAYCQINDPCADHDAGDACVGYEGPGSCVRSDGYLYCEAPPCADKELGDACDSASSGYGTCVAGDGGAELTCFVPAPCANKQEGQGCEVNYQYGTCTQGEGELFCALPQPCEGQLAGDFCYTDEGEGSCVVTGDSLECVVPCAGLVAGDACQGQDGAGVCVHGWDNLVCEPPNPCADLSEGDACNGSFGAGSCTRTDSEPPYYPYPYWPETSSAVTSSAPVVTIPNPPLALTFPDASPYDGGVYADASPGSTTDVQTTASPIYDAGVTAPWPIYDAGAPVPWPPYDGGSGSTATLECLPVGDCSTLPESAPCATASYELGACFIGKCYPQGSPGGIDGLGVDACGNVYASEYVVGNVWRIAPDGTTELLTKLPSSWIPNIKWGRGIGSFERDVMYVADRDEGRLFGVLVGVPGATEFFDIGAP